MIEDVSNFALQPSRVGRMLTSLLRLLQIPLEECVPGADQRRGIGRHESGIRTSRPALR